MPTPMRHLLLGNSFDITLETLSRNWENMRYETTDLDDIPSIEPMLSACRDSTLPDDQRGYSFLVESGALRNPGEGESWYLNRGWEVILLSVTLCNGIVSTEFLLAHWDSGSKAYDKAVRCYSDAMCVTCRGFLYSTAREKRNADCEQWEAMMESERDNLIAEGRHHDAHMLV